MPEIVEVRKFADIIKHNVLGTQLIAINILKGRYTKKAFDGFQLLQSSLPATIEAINTKGKFIYITLKSVNGKTLYLFNTLGLTGGWTVKASRKNDLKEKDHIRIFKKSDNEYYAYPVVWEYISNNNISEWFERALNHLNVEFITDSGKVFYFYDQLSFGTLKIIETKTELDKKLKELGIDMMDETITFEIFKKQITKGINKNKPIGNVIVNQKLISGIGNYLRADALYMAKISPFRKVENITDKEMELLFESIKSLIWGDYNRKEGIKKGLVDKDIKIPGDYNRDFFVYRYDKDINGKEIKKEELYEGIQKRFIFWIPEIQK